jgi:hypothetical protein
MEKVDPSTPDDYANVVPRKKPAGPIEGREFHKTWDPTATTPAAAVKPAAAPKPQPASTDDDGTDI